MNNNEFDFKDIVENALDIIVVTKADLINEPGPEIVYVNQAFVNISGYTREEIIGNNPRILQSDGTDPLTKANIREALTSKQPIRTTIKNFSKSGQEYWLDLSIMPLKNQQGLVTHFMAIQRDVTEQKRLEKQLERLSYTDQLTGLCNLRSFTNASLTEFTRFKRTYQHYSVLMLDIDFFKQVNDTYGHTIGDLAIQHFSDLCKKNIRSNDVIARVGGEEFCILLPNTIKDCAYIIAEKLRTQLNESPLKTDEKTITINVSIGVAVSRIDDSSEREIIDRADKALYDAKNCGRNCVC